MIMSEILSHGASPVNNNVTIPISSDFDDVNHTREVAGSKIQSNNLTHKKPPLTRTSNVINLDKNRIQYCRKRSKFLRPLSVPSNFNLSKRLSSVIRQSDRTVRTDNNEIVDLAMIKQLEDEIYNSREMLYTDDKCVVQNDRKLYKPTCSHSLRRSSSEEKIFDRDICPHLTNAKPVLIVDAENLDPLLLRNDRKSETPPGAQLLPRTRSLLIVDNSKYYPVLMRYDINERAMISGLEDISKTNLYKVELNNAKAKQTKNIQEERRKKFIAPIKTEPSDLFNGFEHGDYSKCIGPIPSSKIKRFLFSRQNLNSKLRNNGNKEKGKLKFDKLENNSCYPWSTSLEAINVNFQSKEIHHSLSDPALNDAEPQSGDYPVITTVVNRLKNHKKICSSVNDLSDASYENRPAWPTAPSTQKETISILLGNNCQNFSKNSSSYYKAKNEVNSWSPIHSQQATDQNSSSSSSARTPVSGGFRNSARCGQEPITAGRKARLSQYTAAVVRRNRKIRSTTHENRQGVASTDTVNTWVYRKRYWLSRYLN